MRDAQPHARSDQSLNTVPGDNPAGQPDLTIEPGVEDRATVQLHPGLLPPGRRNTWKRFEFEGRRVGMGADDPEAGVLAEILRDPPGQDSPVPHHDMTTRGLVPPIVLPMAGIASVNQPLSCHAGRMVRGRTGGEEGGEIIEVVTHASSVPGGEVRRLVVWEPSRDNSLVTLTAATIDAAHTRLQSVVNLTPLTRNDRLSEAFDADIYLKREDLQPVRSYKIRGAYNLIAQLSDAERKAGVLCASAGNHGQGVALSCAILGIRGRVFVPTTTPKQKRQRMLELGAGFIELVVQGDTYDDSAAAAKAAAQATGAIVVPAFDDERTIAGQGTIIPEVISQLGKAPDVIMVPVGGGGLLAGCLTYLGERYPRVDVIGVEPAGAACMVAALDAGGPVDLPTIDTFVDGAAVRRAGEITFRIADRYRPRMVLVPEGRICSEMLAMYQTDGIIAEPAGALASAGLGIYKPRPGATVVVILSGGNNDVSRYSEVVERSLVYEGRKHYFLVNFPQEPGALRRFLDQVLGPDDDITHFEYVKRSNRETGPALVGIELANPDDLAGLKKRMAESRLQVETLSPDSAFYRFLV